MGWSRHDEESRADYYRDRIKHEPRKLTPQQLADELLEQWQLLKQERGHD